jgi:adenylyltransferase/sulfurtransferase
LLVSDVIRLDTEGRFSRFELISWWDQQRLRAARVLVVGAGALGNEVVKNLALLGVGHLVVADMDRVEISNLSRSTLFREADCGRPKAEVAAEHACRLFPGISATGLHTNVLYGVGLGLFRWADVVIGALDNREARLQVGRFSALANRPWVDGGIDVLSGIARVFWPGDGPCYECTLSEADWAVLEQRRACSLLPRDTTMMDRPVPTTPTTASVVAGVQCAEALKILHGMEGLRGEGFHFDGRSYDCYRIRYTRDPNCGGHEPLSRVEPLTMRASTATVADVLERARALLGGEVRLETVREMVSALSCPTCQTSERRTCALDSLRPEDAACGRCGKPRTPDLYHRLDPMILPGAMTLLELGIAPWDVIIGRCGQDRIGLELDGDREPVLRGVTA